MSAAHLASGSIEPPRVNSLLRVYSMKFCPFAQRVRLVVKAKNLPHDIVNINLYRKPEWYFQIHPKGQVPALLDGDKIVIESLDISDYLDEKYPDQSPLYPADSDAKQKDREVIRNLIGPAIGNFSKFLYSEDKYTPEQALNFLLPPIQPLEDELRSRGTEYFGGEKPGMIDYMLWPWAERSSNIAIKLGGEKLPLKEEQIPNLRKWKKAMLETSVVRELVTPPETYLQLFKSRQNKEEPKYDDL